MVRKLGLIVKVITVNTANYFSPGSSLLGDPSTVQITYNNSASKIVKVLRDWGGLETVITLDGDPSSDVAT